MEKNYFQEEERKVEESYLLKNYTMIKLISLNRGLDFKRITSEKKFNTNFFTIYFEKNHSTATLYTSL